MALNNLSIFSMAKTEMAYLTERQKVLATNIANANTPHYLPQDVEEPSFANVLRTSLPMTLTNEKHLAGIPSGNGGFRVYTPKPDTALTIDGNGVAGEAYEFPVPTVDYTVAKPDPAPQPGATDKPSDNGAATDKPGAKTALAKTGDEAFAIGMGCLLVAGASACVIATALKRRRN